MGEKKDATQAELTLNDFFCACSSSTEWIIELVEEGALELVILKIDTKKPLVFNKTSGVSPGTVYKEHRP